MRLTLAGGGISDAEADTDLIILRLAIVYSKSRGVSESREGSELNELLKFEARERAIKLDLEGL